MSINFPLILVLATFITGIVWLIDSLFFAGARKARAASVKDETAKEKALKEPLLVEYSRAFFPVILIVLLLRSFLAEPFRIPSGSMMPTLLVGDFILVNKFAYGLRLPVINTRFLEVGDPQRGDVAVFRYPEDPSIDYIKRVVGVPGDHVVYKDKTLYINGEPMPKQPLGTYIGSGAGAASTGSHLWMENLTGLEHQVLTRPSVRDLPHGTPIPGGSIHADVVVPEGYYFMMGDNRDNSRDSRYFGFVSEEHLVGKAFMIWMSWDNSEKTVVWERIGDKIH